MDLISANVGVVMEPGHWTRGGTATYRPQTDHVSGDGPAGRGPSMCDARRYRARDSDQSAHPQQDFCTLEAEQRGNGAAALCRWYLRHWETHAEKKFVFV